MMDGYIENGEEFLGSIKEMGLAEHDRDAVKAIDEIVKTLYRDLRNGGLSAFRLARVIYFSGAVHGLHIAAVASRMRLSQMRSEAGLDVETGEPLVKESN